MLVGVERNRAAVSVEIAAQGLEVRRRALAGHEAQLHEPARRVIDEDQQRAGLAAVLEPAVLTAIDLDQLAVALASKPGLMERPALLPGQPQTCLRHPLADRLTRDVHAMPLQQDLRCERGSEVSVVLAHKLQHILPDTVVKSVAGRPAS